MNDEILLVQNESGKFEKYEPYAEIVCNTEAEFEKINEAMRQYQGWIDINDRLPDPDEADKDLSKAQDILDGVNADDERTEGGTPEPTE